MRAAYLDTVGMLAVWDIADQWHTAAEQAFADLLQTNVSLVTTSYVLMECGNAAARRPYRDRVTRLRTRLLEDGLIFDPTSDEVEEAWEAYSSGKAGDAAIVDHVSFIVMRRLGITQAFTNDRHFIAAGFEVLF
jgi:predicted nucleic acid-binding protein